MNDIHLQFFVPGIPTAQGSKRHVGRGVMVESSKKLKPWRQDVAGVAQESYEGRAPLDQPLVAILTFFFPRPRSHYRTGRHSNELKPNAPIAHTVAPDVDKLARAILDALTAAGVIRDDSRIADLVAMKRYSDRPGVQVTLGSDVNVWIQSHSLHLLNHAA